MRHASLLAAAASALALGACGGADGPGAPTPLRVTADAGALRPTVATAVATGDGRAITVAHALAGARTVRVAGRPARVLRLDRRLDVAELAVPGLRGRAGVRVRTPRTGSEVSVTVLRGGRPRTLRARVLRRAGVAVSTQGRRVAGRPALELALAVQPGDSGAPVTDASGRLVGIVFARVTGRPLAWAVATEPGHSG